MSDLLLQIIAVRLGALVLAGLLLQALPEPRAERHQMPIASPPRLASAPGHTAHTDPLWRDLRLHD